MELRNLNELGTSLQQRFQQDFVVADYILPDSFKRDVKELGEYKFQYTNFLVHISSTDLDGYIPNIWFVVACVLVFCVGYNINDVAISFPRYKVAVIDITEVMSKSSELQELKRAQDKDMEDLNILVSKAQNELLNEPNKSKFIQKEAEYRKQIETKKKDIDKKYTSRLIKINDNIKNIIAKEAKKSNYNLVLPTGMVISGGEDITENVIKSMK